MCYSIIVFTIFLQITWTLKVFDNFSKFYTISQLLNFENFIVFQIKK